MKYFFFIILTFCIGYDLVTAFFSSDKKKLWSPMTLLSLYFAYYIVFPFLRGANVSNQAHCMLLGGTLLFYLVFKLVFYVIPTGISFRRYNDSIQENNAIQIGTVLFVIGFVSYVLFNGFSMSVISTSSLDDVEFNATDSYGHTSSYITSLMALYAIACAVLVSVRKKKHALVLLVVFLVLSMIIYIVGGFRFRILILALSVIMTAHLYPVQKRVNLFIYIPVFVVLYYSMGVIENTRMYGKGLDMNALNELTSEGDFKEASENISVYEFSAKCMQTYKIDDFILFEPILTTVCMPLPRSLFPWKPKGLYMREANIRIYGTVTHGNAFLNITEAYVSFGWLGIIIYALFLAWLSRLFWDNYLKNVNSIASITSLAVYNGVLFQVISRGYMAQVLTIFVYYLIVPMLLSILLAKVFPPNITK